MSHMIAITIINKFFKRQQMYICCLLHKNKFYAKNNNGDKMNNSYWVETTKGPQFNKLEKNIETDICVIGAGITGISTAYMLLNKGLNICLIDKGEICSGVTENTTAKITSQHGLIYKYLQETFGKEYARKYLQSNEEAIKGIKKIIDTENISCDFEKTTNCIYTCKDEYIDTITEEVETVKELGVNAKLIKKVELPFDIKNGIEFPNQAKFHPLKYLYAIVEILKKNDIQIFTNSRVVEIKHDSDGYKIETENGSTVLAKYVVMATHYPIKNFPGMHFLKMYQDRSYAIMIKPNQKFPKNMYISAETPIASFRPINDEFLIIGGSDHKTGDNTKDLDTCYESLEKYAKEIYPNAEIKNIWATQDCVSLDKVPYIGNFSKLMPNIYIATGYKKWGMTTSYVAAKIISDKILGKENQYEEIYKATRFAPLKNYKEFGNMLKQTIYSLAINKIKIPETFFENIEKDSGGVVEYEGKKIGVYKNENGETFVIEPYCTHLGCELSWNNLEKTWDCPCHGSRYTYEGKVITEPTVKDLNKIE